MPLGSEEETLKAGRAASLQPRQQRSAMAALQETKSCGQRMEEFQRYCWTPDTGQMLGRTLSRWGLCTGPRRGQGPPRGCQGLAVPGSRPSPPSLPSPPADPKGLPRP